MSGSNINNSDLFDIIEIGATEAIRYIVVSCKGNKYKIVQEKLWHMLKQECSDGLDYWFNNAKYLRPIFGEKYDIRLITAIGALFRILNDKNPELPVRGIDANILRTIAGTSEDYDSYFESLLS